MFCLMASVMSFVCDQFLSDGQSDLFCLMATVMSFVCDQFCLTAKVICLSDGQSVLSDGQSDLFCLMARVFRLMS